MDTYGYNGHMDTRNTLPTRNGVLPIQNSKFPIRNYKKSAPCLDVRRPVWDDVFRSFLFDLGFFWWCRR